MGGGDGVWRGGGGVVCVLDFYAPPLYIFRRFEHLPDFLERVQVFLFKHFFLLKVLHRVRLRMAVTLCRLRVEHLSDFLPRVQVFLFKHFCLLKVLHRVLLPPLILRVKVIIY